MSDARIKYILGLDLGVASVGWALGPCDYSQISEETLKMGSRIFDPGTDGNKIEEGKDESRNKQRRQARGVRRNIWRRRRRAVKLFNILQNACLLPSTPCHTPEARQTLFNALDVDLKKRYFPNADRVTSQTFLYKLRAMALDRELDSDAVGRIFYALGQRRGFLSNKKTEPEDEGKDPDLGKVKGDIANLEKAIQESGSRTLGEYFSKLDPEEIGSRIRARYVGRQAYKDEFEKIWEAQRQFRPDVYTDALKEKIFKGIFFQRPLKSQKFLVSKCDLEPSCRCIAKGDPLFQEFRYWHRVLDMTVFDPQEGRERPLTREEQDIIVNMLEDAEQVKFDDMREALGKPKKKKNLKDWKFNFELDAESADKVIIGNKTRARIRKAFKSTSAAQPGVADLDRIAAEILFYDVDSALALKLRQLYPTMSEETAFELSKVRLEPDYGSLSRKAINRILPLMKEKRVPFATARKELYGEELLERAAGKAVDLLAPVADALGAVRNPTVTRALTETRKVVNAIIRRYGKPEFIRVELARDLKRGRKEREEIFKSNKDREKERKVAEAKIRETMGYGKDEKITGRDVLKYRLWLECDGVCPYTGKEIPLRTLFSKESPVDIEHIIPFSISLDDSFGNKTLCYADEN
ncbi:MAG: type II CRISPR RNA-guided endonuclease Cas9, partial [Thermoguttaceae bacterium]|nr:type II CRISPR RNA-guided endonuclease Cas9 [Thermoguttaceae bacterium]